MTAEAEAGAPPRAGARFEEVRGVLRTAHGDTAYGLAGPAGAPLVVLVHGIVGPSAIWDPTLPALHAAARRTLRYDLYGRGGSARALGVEHGLALYARQLADLLDAVGHEGPADLLGLSMGGAVAAGFADLYPARAGRLALIAPAGLRRPRPWLARAARALVAPGLGEGLMAVLGARTVERGLSRSFRDPAREPARGYIARAALQGRDPGFRAALLASLRDMPLDRMEDAFARAGRGREVLVIWGAEDAIAPPSGAERLQRAIPHARLHVLEGGAHNVHYEDGARTDPLLAAFFGEGGAAAG